MTGASLRLRPGNKAQLPNNAHKLKQEFKLSEDDLELVYPLPHTVALEPYVKDFQYKVLNSILYIKYKLIENWLY